MGVLGDGNFTDFPDEIEILNKSLKYFLFFQNLPPPK